MKISDVLLENTNTTLDRIKDILMYMHIKGIPSVATDIVLKELESKGIAVSVEELFPLIDQVDFIKDINKDEITFNSDTPTSSASNKPKVDTSKETVEHLARRARNRRMK